MASRSQSVRPSVFVRMPVVVNALQWTGTNLATMRKFLDLFGVKHGYVLKKRSLVHNGLHLHGTGILAHSHVPVGHVVVVVGRGKAVVVDPRVFENEYMRSENMMPTPIATSTHFTLQGSNEGDAWVRLGLGATLEALKPIRCQYETVPPKFRKLRALRTVTAVYEEELN